MAETQPQLQSALLRLLAMISQYFTGYVSGKVSTYGLLHQQCPSRWPGGEIDLIFVEEPFRDFLFAFDLAETLKEVKTESAALTAHDVRHRHRGIAVLSVVYGLLGLLLLPWPIASFTAIFFFDAPIRSLGDEISRYLAAFAIWLYPVFYGIALVISLVSLRKKESLPLITLPALLPLLSPLCLLAFFAL